MSPETLTEERRSLPHGRFLPPLSEANGPHRHGFISGLAILFHWSMRLFLCQDLAVLMTASSLHSVISGGVIPPPLFSFLIVALAIRGLLWFHINFRVSSSGSVKRSIIGI